MQFRLKSVLALVAIASFLFFLATTKLVTLPFLTSLLITTLVPIALLGMIVYHDGYHRAFAIGAILPMALLVYCSMETLSTFSEYPRLIFALRIPPNMPVISPFIANTLPPSLPWGDDPLDPAPIISRTWLFSTLALLGGTIVAVTKWIRKPVVAAKPEV